MTYGKRSLLGVAAAVIAATLVAGASAGNGHGASGGEQPGHGQQQSGWGRKQSPHGEQQRNTSPEQTASAQAVASGHVTICHATGNGGYVEISPDVSGVFHGHYREHGRDIVPPFSYGGHTYSLNWTSAGQAIWSNGCKAPASAPGAPSSSGSSGGTGNGGSSAAANSPAQSSPRLLVHKQERVGAVGAFSDGPVNAAVGDMIFYEVVVNDDGNTALDVTLSDPRCDAGTIVPDATKPIELNPQGTVSYTCSHVLTAADAGTFTNVVTATGTIPGTTSWVQGQSGVVAHVSASGVRGASKTLKKVTRKARPAARKAAVKAASFTG